MANFEQALAQRVHRLVLERIAEPARAPFAHWIETAALAAQFCQGAVAEPAEWSACQHGQGMAIIRVDLQAQGGEQVAHLGRGVQRAPRNHERNIEPIER